MRHVVATDSTADDGEASDAVGAAPARDVAADFVRALATRLADDLAALDAAGATTIRLAVAFSGGADSTALLHATAAWGRAARIDVVALHVHHGIAEDADAWLDHCARFAARLGVAFDAERVTPGRERGSLEGAARALRYGALARLCARHACRWLLTAHHEDDQAETVLVNVARGAGIGGLAAAARRRWIGDVLLSRPLIDVRAAMVRGYVAAEALPFVVDPSNDDRRFTRNAMRHEALPALRRIVPTIATRLSRTAAHAAAMQSLLDEIGDEDLRRDRSATDPSGNDLDVDRLASLSHARAANALRVWLARRGMRAPSAAALDEMLHQLLHASPDAQIALLHERRTLRLYRGRVSLDHGGAPRTGSRAIAWDGQDAVDVPEWNGTLLFASTEGRGFDPLALREGPLVLRERRGGERLRTRGDGPTRTLKNLYQEAGVAAWQRTRLPLVYLGDRLVFAAGLGPNEAAMADGGDRILLTWKPHD